MLMFPGKRWNGRSGMVELVSLSLRRWLVIRTSYQDSAVEVTTHTDAERAEAHYNLTSAQLRQRKPNSAEATKCGHLKVSLARLVASAQNYAEYEHYGLIPTEYANYTSQYNTVAQRIEWDFRNETDRHSRLVRRLNKC